MDDLKGKRVLIFQQRNWALKIGHEVAKEFQAKGCRLAALTIHKGADNFVRSQKDISYDLVVFGDEMKFDPAGFLGEDDYSLDEICDDLGIVSVWELAQSMRNHVKCYADKYYYGFKQNMSDEDIVLYMKAIYKNIRNVFDNFSPEIIISPNFVALQHSMFYFYAKKRGITMIGVSDSKISGLYYFSHTPLEDLGPFMDRCNALNAGAKSPNQSKGRKYIEDFCKNFITIKAGSLRIEEPVSLFQRIKKEILPYYMGLIYYKNKGWRSRNLFGVTIDTITPKYMLRDHYARKRYCRATMSFPYYDLDKIGRFAFLPLQFQPEATIDTQSARFNNQIETARQVAMSLPGDMTLVVKDHPTMVGYRPPSYLEKISRLPNVKLVDPRVHSEKILKRASLVVTSGGTVIFEAAVLRVPCIQMGGLGKTLLLPNISRHTDFSSLDKKIVEILSWNMDSSEYDQRLINYVAAMYDVGFEADYTAIWESGVTDGLSTVVRHYVDEAAKALGRGK